MLDCITSEYGGKEDFLTYLASRCYATLQPFWAKYVEPSPKAFLNSEEAGQPVCTVPVVMRRTGLIEVGQIQFPVSASATLLRPTYMRRTEEVIGWGRLPEDAGKMPFDFRSEGSTMNYIDRLYSQAALVNPESVGGGTDVGFVDLNGTCWVRRKTLY